jgi:hypothetical protein
MPGDCAELKSQSGSIADGDYTVLVLGLPVKVYCHQMNHSIPRTYVNVNSDSNMAEIYGKRYIKSPLYFGMNYGRI